MEPQKPNPILIFGKWRVFSDLSVYHDGNEILTHEGGVTRQIDGPIVLTAAKIRGVCIELCCITGRNPEQIITHD